MFGLINQIRFFMYDSLNVKIILASLLISLIAFLFLKFDNKLSNKKKLGMVYLHIGALVFPLIFFLYSAGCRTWFNGCSRIDAIIYITILALISGGLTVLFVTPFFFLYKHIKKSKRMQGNYLTSFVEKYSRKFKIKNPKIYLLKIARPVAFSFSNIKSYIFLSVGMLDILSRNEIKAVLLHELGHLVYKSPSLKLSTFLMKFISPLARFSTLNDAILDKEERKADRFASKLQKTDKHVKSAKRKIEQYMHFR